MASALLDFVMGLVRDADAAARYAADPAGALRAAGLDGVTAADVDNLVPMVTDSLAMSTPDFGGAARAAADPNVWASAAASVAFDAFGDLAAPRSGAGAVPGPGVDVSVDRPAAAADPAAGVDPTASGPDLPGLGVLVPPVFEEHPDPTWDPGAVAPDAGPVDGSGGAPDHDFWHTP